MHLIGAATAIRMMARGRRRRERGEEGRGGKGRRSEERKSIGEEREIERK